MLVVHYSGKFVYIPKFMDWIIYEKISDNPTNFTPRSEIFDCLPFNFFRLLDDDSNPPAFQYIENNLLTNIQTVTS